MTAKEFKNIPKYTGPRAVRVWFEAEKIYMEMHDGRTIGVPVSWFPRLANATENQRNNLEIYAHGYGVHWPDIDEDLSAEGMFTYIPKKVVEHA